MMARGAIASGRRRDLGKILGGYSDRFDGTVVNAYWNFSYGSPTVSGGLGRVPTVAQVNGGGSAGFESGTGENFTNAAAWVKVAAASRFTAFMLVHNVTAGTRLGFDLNAPSINVRLANDVNYTESVAVNMAYDAVQHAWFRLREGTYAGGTAGQTYMETSPDGASWTLRRQLATPTWMTSVRVGLSTYNDLATAGTEATFDNYNVLP